MSERAPLGDVVVATDFSGAAMRAVERAARLPMGSGSTLTVLHVLPPGSAGEDRAEAEGALRYAASLAADVRFRVGRSAVGIVTRLAEGTPFVEIVRVISHKVVPS